MKKHELKDAKITIELTAEQASALALLASGWVLRKADAPINDQVLACLSHLIHASVDGVNRPGSWERQWLCQAFGDDWEKL